MPDPSLWLVPGLLVALGLLGWAAAALDAVLGAAAAGRAAPLRAAAEPLREAARLLVQQRRTTTLPDALLWRLGGAGVLVAAALASVVTPLGSRPVADLTVGLVWWNAFMALLWVAVWLTGWGGNSVHPLVAGYRFVAQALAYEMPLAITLITVGLAASSLRVGAVVEAQRGLWFVVWMPAGFAVYLTCALALSFYGPLSAPVSTDAAGGVAAELSGVDRLVFLAGRYVVLAAAAAFAVPLFLGGDAGPGGPSPWWVLVKTLLVLALLVLARWRLPLVRPDRFEEVGWMVLLPVTLVQSLVVAIVVLARG